MIEIAQETRTQSVQCMVKRRRGHTGLTSLACFLPRTSPWRGGGVRLLDAGAGGNAAALLAGIAAAAGAGLCTKLGVNKTTSTNASREFPTSCVK